MDVTLAPGELVALVGASGSGKTTLLNLLGCLDRPTAGTVRVQGTEVQDLSERQLTGFRRRAIGFVFQEAYLIPTLTALENVGLPLAFDRDRIQHSAPSEALERVGLADKTRRYPSELSGGERQRVAIAEFRQCIAIDPKESRPHLQLGRLLAAKARREGHVPSKEVVAELKEAVRLSPDDLQAAFELADIVKERNIGTFDLALTVELFEKILKANPSLYDVRLRYATWLAVGEVRLTIPAKGRASRDSGWTMDMARANLEKVLDQVSPDSEQAKAANFMLSHVLMKMGQWPELVNQTKMILQRFPDLPPDRKWQTVGMLGHGYLRQGLHKLALETFMQEYDLGGGNRALWDIHLAAEGLGGWDIYQPERITGYPKDLPEKYRFPFRAERYGKDLPHFGTGNPDIRRMEPNILYMNNGHGYFVDRTRSAEVGTLGKGHGVTFLDWDGDGYLEMYAEVGGFYHGDFWRRAFYQSEGAKSNHWLEVELSQEGHNRQAVGAAVTVLSGDLNQYQEVRNGRGFGSSDPPILHYGLGKNLRVEKLTVRWLDNTTVDYPPPPVDKKIKIRKGDATWSLRTTP